MKTKILIVDDKPENIVALEGLLKHFDAVTVKATSGNEALILALEHDFALALIDVQMPGMDGFETVRLMRQIEKTRYLPVIFLSAIYSEDHYKILGIEAGAVDFITKPYVPRIVLGKIRIFIELYENRKRLEEEIEQRRKTEAFLRETESRLLNALAHARESDRLKTAFLENVSHEIRTPLTTILGFSGLLANTDTDREVRRKFYGIISKSGETLLNILNDILDVARIETNQFRVITAPADINLILRDLESAYREVLRNNEKSNISLNLHLPAESPGKFVTDESRLKQALSNLLSNAVKFTLKGRIDFGYNISGKGLTFFVKDTGIGIPEDRREIIFDRFRKIENRKALNTAGTGLGLPIVKKITELLGGKVIVRSEINKGSEFTIELPWLHSATQKTLSEPVYDRPI
jgi:two-component system, sensor histidine kinase